MVKTFVYEFVFGLPDGEQSRIHTVRSNNGRDAVKAIQRYNTKRAIQRYNTKDEVIAFHIADLKTSGLRGTKAEKDIVVEHPTMPTIRSLASEPD